MKLSDVCDVYSGYAFKKFNDLGHGVPVIKISNLLSDGSIDLINCLFTTENFKEKFYSKKNDIYIALSGATTGKVGIMDKDDTFVINQRVGIVRNRSTVPNEYLKYFLMSKSNRILEEASGCAQPNISPKQIADYDVPIFSDAEMIKIVSELREIDKVKSIYQRRLELLDELVKARFVEMFGDPNIEFKYNSIKFNDLVVRMTKGPFGSDMKKDLFVPKGEDTYKVYIQINAIQKNQSLGEYYISKEYFDRKVSRFELFPNDYIITCDGTLGKYLKLDENMEKGVISPSLLRLTLQSDKINDKYFENIWDFYMLGLMKKEARNACLMHLPSAKKIGEISIPIPPLELQNQFASFVQEIDKSRLLSNHSLSLIKSIIF